jgi:hypothetical protein
MRPKKVMLVTVLCASSFCVTEGRAEQINTAQHSVTVKYKTGEIEHYVVVWTADVQMNVGEDGGPAVPLQGHFVDDRRCHWNISGEITRQVFLVSRTGQQYASPSLARVYNKAQQNQGSSFMLAGLRSENCNDAAARRNSDLSNMKTALNADFTNTVNADFATVQSELKKDASVVNVSGT